MPAVTFLPVFLNYDMPPTAFISRLCAYLKMGFTTTRYAFVILHFALILLSAGFPLFVPQAVFSLRHIIFHIPFDVLRIEFLNTAIPIEHKV